MTVTIINGGTPSVANQVDDLSYELGTKFTLIGGATLTAINFFRAVAETGSHTIKLWSTPNPGSPIYTQLVANSSPGTVLTNLNAPQVLAPGDYTLSVNVNTAYGITRDFFLEGAYPLIIDGVVTLPTNAGVFANINQMPVTSFRAANYYIGGVLTHGEAPPGLKMMFLKNT